MCLDRLDCCVAPLLSSLSQSNQVWSSFEALHWGNGSKNQAVPQAEPYDAEGSDECGPDALIGGKE